MDINFSLSEADVSSLPQSVKDALLTEIQRILRGTPPTQIAFGTSEIAENVEVNAEEGQPADLSVNQATRFLEGCREKTKRVIRTIVEGKSREFRLSALAKALGMTTDDLHGVWGGLTKRTRTILGDNKSKIIAWPKNFYDADDNWIDATGAVSEVTYASFRKAFGI